MCAALLGLGAQALRAPAALPFPYVGPARSALGPLPPPRSGERPLLNLRGKTTETLTLSQLRALPATRYNSTQPQLGQSFTYQGVPLRDLARRGGFAGRDLRVTAEDGFVATITASDYMTAPIMVAYEAGGKPIPTLKKGPLLIVFPPDPVRFPRRPYGSQWVWFVRSVGPR
ncbi:hypothetical protein C8263_09885 [Deinococcus arcticus]|uniref:Oxidoreductase molybdopterin-binding domain-containing protein n=2 Tax=Deinococcus arcticus TaxID=2136176 RepID=A0A2T3W848_9DEIO|nr:hypothetical protein C8263_09885 [Deinococcus arcticus]